jgi:hypothetical protein
MINKTYRELFSSEEDLKTRLKLFFCEPECYETKSIEDLLKNKWRLFNPFYKSYPSIEANIKNPYEKLMYSMTRDILKDSVLITIRKNLWAINTQSEEAPWIYDMELRDGGKHRLKIKYFDESKYADCIENLVKDLEEEYCDKDPQLDSILRKLYEAKDQENEDEIFNGLNSEDQIHFNNMSEKLIFEATKIYTEVSRKEGILCLLETAAERMQKEKNKTNLIFENGILLGYNTKTKIFSLMDII